jgi:outer membrane protein assembly complex protein YaeT
LLVAAGLALALLALLHAPPVRARALAWGADFLERSYGLAVEVAGIDYNLLTLGAELHDVHVAAGDPPSPLFDARALRIELPWSAVWSGAPRIDLLEIDDPHIRMTRGKDGTWNFPSLPDDGGTDEPAPIVVGRLRLGNTSLTVDDGVSDLSVDVRGLDLDLRPSGRGSAGQLLLRAEADEGSARVRYGETSTVLTELAAGVSFDGSTLEIADLRLRAPEGEVHGAAQIGLLQAEPKVAADYEVALQLESIERWLVPPAELGKAPGIRGALRASGRVSGPIQDPAIELNAEGDGLSWSTLDGISLRLRSRFASGAFDIEESALGLAGGVVSGTGTVSVGGTSESAVALTWRDLEAGSLVQAAAPDSPVSPRARLSGRLEARWLEASASGIAATLENAFEASRAPVTGRHPPGRLVPIAGTLRFGTSAGRWTLQLDDRVAETLSVRGRLEGRFPPEDYTQSPLEGQLQVDAEDLGRLTTHAGIRELSALEPIQGALRGVIDISGTIGSPRADATLQGSGLMVAGTGPTELHARLDADRERVRIAVLEARTGGNAVDAEGSVALGTTSRIAATFRARLADPMALVPPAVAPLEPRGTISVEGRIGGTLDRPSALGEIQGEGIGIAGQREVGLSGRFRLAGTELVVEALEVAQNPGRLTLDGRYDFGTRRFSADGRARGFKVDPLTGIGPPREPGGEPGIDVEALVDLDVQASGSASAPSGLVSVQAADVRWDQRDLGTISGRIEMEGGSARLSADMPLIDVTLTGNVDLRTPYGTTARADVTDVDLAVLAELLAPGQPAPIAGTATLSIEARGELAHVRDANVVVDLQAFDSALGERTIRLSQPSRLSYTSSIVGATNLELLVGASTLRAHGSIGSTPGSESLVLTLTGNLGDVAALQPSLTTDLAVSGPVRATATVSGTIGHPTIRGELAVEGGSIAWRGQPPATNIQVAAEYRDGDFVLENIGAEWQSTRLSASGVVPARLFEQYLPRAYLESLPSSERAAVVRGRVQSLSPSVAEPFVAPDLLAELEGRAEASFELTTRSLAPDDLEGALEFGELQLAIAGVPIAQRRPTRVVIEDRQLRIDDWNWGAEGNELQLTGRVGFAEAVDVDITAAGTVDLRAASLFLPSTVSAGGRATIDLRLHGTAAALLADGEVRLTGAEVALDDPRLAITEVQGRIAFSRDRAVLEDVAGLANGGYVQAFGSISYPGKEVGEGNIQISAQSVALEWPEGLQTEIDGTVALEVGKQLRLTGDVAIGRGSYRELMSIPGLLATLRGQGATTQLQSEPSPLDRLELGVNLYTTDDIRVDNNYGRVNLAADLRVVGTLSRPALAGRAVVREGGEVYLGGRAYFLEAGSVDFVSPTRIEPDVNLSARTRVAGTDVNLKVTGTPETMSVDLASDNPDLTQADLTSLLLTGQTSFAGETASVARDQVLTLLSGELFGVAGLAIGLDALRIDQGFVDPGFRFDPGLVANETDPSSRLTFSKRFSRQFELVFSQSLRESGDLTWIGSYHMRNDLELRAVSHDNSDRSYEFRHDVSFGGPDVRLDASQLAGSPAASPRVREVRFAGTPAVPIPELAQEVSLQAGDRFDYYTWQDDSEKLLTLHRNRGYREASVVGRRLFDGGESPAGASAAESVTLEYAIERGPRTSLEIVGVVASSDLRRELEEAWSRSVFDRFLRDELGAIARAHLMSRGYVQPTIEVAIRRSADGAEKTIVLTIEPGVHSADREIVFAENVSIGSERLADMLQQVGVRESAWIDPAPAERAIEELYRSEGWLEAAASAGSPELAPDGSARLVFTLDEGPLFRVGRIAFDGVALGSESELRSRSALQSGSSYAAAPLETARVAIETTYREQGFNAARVSATTSVDRDRDAVDIAFTIEEGRRQVLRDVVVTGALRTNPGFVRQALQLEVGRPVNLVEWYRARKRLYDTGVFRRADVRAEVIESAPASAEEEPVRARVELEEWPPFRLQYGLQVVDEPKPAADTRQFGLGLASDLTHRNLFGRATTAGISLRYTRDAQVGRVFARAPAFFGLPISSNLFASRSHEERGEESVRPLLIDITDFTAEQRVRPLNSVELAYGFSIQRNHTFREPLPSDPIPFDLVVNIGRLTSTGLIDTRDDLVSPGGGWFHSSSFEYGTEFESGIRFARYLGQGSYYRSIGGGVVVASGLRLGVANAFGDELLPSERFFTGGARSVRGYAEDSLGPQFGGFPAGGEALLVLNGEVRAPIYRWVGGVAFFDAGNTFASPEQLSISDLRSSVGFGLRFNTPVGLLRLDAGFPRNRQPGEPRFRWTFSLGQAF